MRYELMRKLLHAFLLALSLLPTFAFAGAYSLVSTSTANDDNTGNDFTANMPSSWSAGNLLLLATAPRGGSAETLTTPSGWTVLKTFTDSGGSIVLLGRIAQAGDTGPTISWSGTSHAWAKMAAWSGDIYTDLTTIVDNSNQASAGSSDLLNVPSLTVGVNDTLVIGISRKNKTTTSNGATVTFAGGFTTLGSGSFTGSRQTYAWGYIQQTTAANISSTDWTVSISEANTRTGITVSLKSSSATPTFTSAPAIGTRTTSSLPINATSDTTGTMYGGRLTDGSGTPTCDQLEAQTATGGVQYASEAVVATVADTLTFSSITDGTVTDGYFCIEDGSGNDSAVASIANMYKLPAFTTALTVASQTDTAYTSNSKILDGPGTVDLVACAKDASPPSVSQVEARTGGCIVNGATDDATGTMVLTITGTIFPIYDLYYVGSYGGQHEAAVHTLADESLDAPAGKQYVTLASVSATSWCDDFNDTQTPDIAAGDIIKIDLVTDPDGFTWTQGTDCDGNYSGTSARQSLEYDIYDTSVGAYMAGGPGTLWFNNQAPVGPEANSIRYNFPLNSAITPINIASLCYDPEDDALTATNVSALPTGLSVSSSLLQGTPTARGFFPNLVFSCTDITGETTEWQ